MYTKFYRGFEIIESECTFFLAVKQSNLILRWVKTEAEAKSYINSLTS